MLHLKISHEKKILRGAIDLVWELLKSQCPAIIRVFPVQGIKLHNGFPQGSVVALIPPSMNAFKISCTYSREFACATRLLGDIRNVLLNYPLAA